MTFKKLFNRFPTDVKRKFICAQNSIYHPEIWVYTHTKYVFNHVINQFGNDTDMLLSALFHDIAKKDYRTINKYGRFTHINHEIGAMDYIDKYIHLFNDLNPNIKRIKEVCFYHMKAHLYINGTLKKKSKREKFESLKYFDDIIKFAKCDSKGK